MSEGGKIDNDVNSAKYIRKRISIIKFYSKNQVVVYICILETFIEKIQLRAIVILHTKKGKRHPCTGTEVQAVRPIGGVEV
jgi:hypothetical protein